MRSKDKVVFININAYPCVVGGIEVFNLYFVNEMSKTYPNIVFTSCKKIAYKNSKIVQLPKIPFQRLTLPIQVLFKLFRFRKEIKIVHVSFSKNYWTHWYVYVLAKKLFKIDYMITIHGGGLAPWIPQWPYQSFFKNAKCITGVSERIQKEYHKRSKRDIIYTPPLVPFSIQQPSQQLREKWQLKEDETVLLYVGSIKPLKATDSLIEALGLLSNQVLEEHNIKVMIAGDGPLKESLLQRAVELKIDKYIRFLGNVDRTEVAELYAIANLYTICSEYEGLPISLLEAFANKLPCITSAAPGLENLSNNGENTILFEIRNTEEYSIKILQLLTDKDYQKSLAINSHNFYNKSYSYDQLVEKFINLIEE